jgi:non-homologous end joining protein Ku
VRHKITRTAEAADALSLSRQYGPNWKGFLRLSLVTRPVGAVSSHVGVRKGLVQPAEPKDRPSHQVRKVDADTGEEVANEDIVKGYKVDTDTFIEVTKEELENVRWNRREPSRSTSSSTAAKSTRDI